MRFPTTSLFLITLIVTTITACGETPTPPETPAKQEMPVEISAIPATSIEPESDTSSTTSPPDPKGEQLRHAVAMHGTPKYPKNFQHMDYTNPNAPQGGTLKQAAIGSFDSFNPFITKGVSAGGLGLVFETLTTSSADEAFTQYGLLAQHIQMPDDRSWVIFHINPNARFSDDKPVTADDVVFSFNTLIEKGQPFYQFYYAGVERIEALDTLRVKFSFKPGDNKELALIVGQIPVLPKHHWENKEFAKVNLNTPLGSGPYVLKSFEAGKQITYAKNPNYWGKDLAIKAGIDNFDQVIYEYFLDTNIALEAFKAGHYDFHQENNSKLWATQFDVPAVESGDIILENLAHQQPAGMQGFIFNLRRPLFQDPVLRQAMSYAFDFEWSNKFLFYGQYTRSQSYFQNTELAARELPDNNELALLDPLKDQIPAEVFTKVYQTPKTDGSGKSRQLLRQGITLLKNAGYTINEGQLMTPDSTPVEFEFLMQSNSGFERILLPFIQNLEILGIKATPRNVDINQYIERKRQFDFDMVVHTFGQSLSPGNEQRDYWHSEAADKPNSRNLIGIQNPAIDTLVEQLIQAQNREDLITRTRALDRVLLWNHYLIPNWHISSYRLAYWSHLKRPEIMPPYGLNVMTWWSEPKPAEDSNPNTVTP